MIKKSLILLSLFGAGVQAQEDWWFEVEVLLYKRDQAVQTLDEQFPQPAELPSMQRAVDLITPLLLPNIDSLIAALPACEIKQEESEEIPFLEPGLLDAVNKRLDELAQYRQPTEMMPQSTGAQIVGALPVDQASQTQADSFAFRIPRVGCVQPYERDWFPAPIIEYPEPEEFIAQVPTPLSGRVSHQDAGAYIIPSSALELRQLARDLYRQRGNSPLLHLAWRQQVTVGKSKAAPFRLYGGTNFAKAFDLHGLPLPLNPQSPMQLAPQQPSKSLIEQVEEALNQPLRLTQEENQEQEGVTTDQLWELDGLFKVYLQYINRVPYLHVDTNLVYRKEGPAGLMGTPLPLNRPSSVAGLVPNDTRANTRLYDFSFDQLRRVISKQIHYFDHPMFGMVVQIRRYEGDDE
ncbi:CsiV family protein [Aliiglaciecola sp. CAU 1673]|uniref:CsiV family protein n=1 Tax=Aliiglaciecola sp. CAU 1673 TaxID=3032595 RepID=UPI0023DB7C84|nr:CsiV family protein [Aliiglaciecola sp. CAU 1673]MDF2178841.1 CsiV family protein [Aliiglaciecola sp. CAU 1673]